MYHVLTSCSASLKNKPNSTPKLGLRPMACPSTSRSLDAQPWSPETPIDSSALVMFSLLMSAML